MVKHIFNPAAGWLYVFHESPAVIIAQDKPFLKVPPGLVEIYQRFYGASVDVIANEKLPT